MVLPEPRKPVRIVMGIAGAMVFYVFFFFSFLLFVFLSNFCLSFFFLLFLFLFSSKRETKVRVETEKP